ncbi:MAG: hypothetical protein WA843_04545 [Candidatus Saccharimonadales bacterium]
MRATKRIAPRKKPTDRRGGLWDKIWRDRQGHVVLFQAPNIWIIIWALATVLLLFTNGDLADGLRVVARVALAGWAVLEITTGLNYFRRILGGIILLLTIGAIFKM